MKLKIAFTVLALATAPTLAAYVTPTLGGGQVTGMMVMPRVLFDGSSLSIPSIDGLMSPPVLRPLTPPDEFDPTKKYAILQGKAYNQEYGWFAHADTENLPSGSSVWIEVISQTPGLKTYEAGTYNPIFGTDGSSTKWLWSGAMTHNSYAVAPQIGSFSATYHLYVGDSTGVAQSQYGDTQVTLNWTSVPEPASLGALALGATGLLRRRRV